MRKTFLVSFSIAFFLLSEQVTAQQMPELKKGVHREQLLMHFPDDTTGSKDYLQWEYIYNAKGQLIRVVSANDSIQLPMDTMNFFYNRKGRLTSEIHLQQEQVSLTKKYTYSKHGVSVETIIPGGKIKVFETYDKYGHLLLKRNVNQEIEWQTVCTYDDAGRLLTRNESQNKAAGTSWFFSSSNQTITYFKDSSRTETGYNYLQDGTRYTDIISYNAKNEKVKQVQIVHDSDLRFISRQVYDSLVYSKNKNGAVATFFSEYTRDTQFVRIKGKTFFVVTGKRIYDQQGKLIRTEQYTSGTYYSKAEGYILKTHGLSRDEYQYDTLGRLQKLTEFNSTSRRDTIPYRTNLYDTAGHILRQTTEDEYQVWTYNSSGLLVETQWFDFSGLVNSERYTYDKAGNLTRHLFNFRDELIEEIYLTEYY